MTSVFEASHPPPKNSDSRGQLRSLVKGRGIDLHFTGTSGDTHSVLQQCDFDLFEGESLVLIGPSGQGKTSVLKMMAGLVDASAGHLEFEGENWSKLSITQRNYHYRKRGMLFQKNALFDSMSALENVCFPLRETSELSDTEIQQQAKNMLNAVALSQTEELRPDEMSGGMQKRLGIARALVLRPPILLNDDPVAGLDPITSRKIIELILQIKKDYAITLVSVLNDINRAFELATRIIFVANQKTLDLGTPAQARQSSNPDVQKFLSGEAF